MSCTQVRKKLDELLVVQPDEALPQELVEHIKVCPSCRREHEVAARTLASIQPSHRVEVSEHLKEKIMSTIVDMNGEATRPARTKRRSLYPWKPLAAAGVAVLLLVLASFAYVSGFGGIGQPRVSAFSLLSTAWAAEEALLTDGGIVHIVNEIIVTPLADPAMAAARWFPLMAVEASGTPRFHQLALGAEPGEEYVVDDQAWYDPATGRFVRLLSAGDAPLFANAYNGAAVYSLEPGADGALQVVTNPVTEGFLPPASPAEFLGLAAGLPSGLDETDETRVSYVGRVKLDDGSRARVVRSTLGSTDGAPEAMMDTHFLFTIREDDNTIAEMEWILGGESALVVRRSGVETLHSSDVQWDLAGIDDLVSDSPLPPKEKGGLLGLLPDMVISDVSAQHMIEKADFETYLFETAPPWTSEREITDILDVPSPTHRMFAIVHHADDGRHVILFQAHTYNEGGRDMVKEGTLAYESPSGVKVWSGPKGKWLAGILINSTPSVKGPPAKDRTGYLIETPHGTFPGLAVNGKLTDDEFHALIDSLVPAKEPVQ